MFLDGRPRFLLQGSLCQFGLSVLEPQCSELLVSPFKFSGEPFRLFALTIDIATGLLQGDWVEQDRRKNGSHDGHRGRHGRQRGRRRGSGHGSGTNDREDGRVLGVCLNRRVICSKTVVFEGLFGGI